MEKGTSSQASSGPSYEVFLSFRGEDTRDGFTDFLYHGMVKAGILVFRDNESLHFGDEIGGKLLQAIENSKIYVPIFSTNYASSKWCLRELAHMVKCTPESNGNKEILPIFFDVEPADVKLKTDLYKETLPERQKTLCSEVESWKNALIEVGKIKGWNWKKGESQADLVTSVIETVVHKLNLGYKKIVTEDLVGVDDRVEAIIKMLDVGSNSVQFLGIHGMGGIGKTTLAKVIFNRLLSHFKDCSFLSDVRELSQRHGLVYLQKQLLSKFVDRSDLDQIHDLDEGINRIKRVLGKRKVLIVLDDVDGKEQLESLAKEDNWFGSGSRILITTRYRSVLAIEGEATSEHLTKEDEYILKYEVSEMEFDHALTLFSRHAFRRDSPPDHYISLSKAVVSTLGKLPLALEITGSSLNNKPEEFWKDTLEKLKDAPPDEVRSRLMITYDKLDYEQQQVFLDIACFFIYEDKTYPFYMWDACEFRPHDAIEVLFLMSLIKIKDDNTFWMHDQVRDLGRDIVRRENRRDPCKRSRLWDHEKTWSILKGKEGSREIEALSLGIRRGILTHDELANLQKLRFFKANRVSLVGNFNNLLPNLTWLSCSFELENFYNLLPNLTWLSCSFKLETKNFHPTNLVVLDLSRSTISEEMIGWIGEARKLKVLDLSYCRNLRRTPDLSKLVVLERLILEDCDQLIEIVPSISELKLLTFLNLNGCYSLQELHEGMTEIAMPPMPHEFEPPQMSGSLESLLTFDLSYTQISKLPRSIGGMVKLTVLRLCGCVEIEELPDSIGNLQSLIELDLSFTGISHLPDSIGNLKQLKILRMIDIEGITNLPIVIGLLEKLEELDARDCRNLTGGIPEEIGRLSCLRILNLSCTKISGLPTTLSRLSNLQKLKLSSCDELRHLPELPPSLTRLTWHTKAELESVSAFLTSISTLSRLKKLRLAFPNVPVLHQLPSSLRELRLEDMAITRSPDFSNLNYLSTLEFFRCSMPELSGIVDAELETIDMFACTFTRLDALFQLEMKRLTSLTLQRCEFLPEVLDLSHMKNLHVVDLEECKLLVEIRGLEELGSLSYLEVRNCRLMERISDLSKLRKLRRLRVYGCPKVRSLEGLNHLESLKVLHILNCESLESLADTSNLDLKCSQIVGCEKLTDRRNYCKAGSTSLHVDVCASYER